MRRKQFSHGAWDSGQVLLQTERLVLRPAKSDDASALSALMTPDVSQWLANWPIPFEVNQAAARISTMEMLVAAGDAVAFSIRRREDDRVAGWVSLVRHSENFVCGSLSFWLGTQFQGLGYMRECLVTVIAAGFNRLGFGMIEGGAQVENFGSLAVMRAAGMRPAGRRMVFAPAREREEWCEFYQIGRQA